MSHHLRIHPENPQTRQLEAAVRCLREDGLVAYPTDSGYALGWIMGNKQAQDRVERMRKTDKHHNFTVVCRDLSEISHFAIMDNVCYRLIKAHTPGPYTFILPATSRLPRRLRNVKRQSVGIRLPDHIVCQALLDAVGEPIMSSSLLLPQTDMHALEVDDLVDLTDHLVDMFIDCGYCQLQPTTVVDMLQQPPEILREGAGIVDFV